MLAITLGACSSAEHSAITEPSVLTPDSGDSAWLTQDVRDTKSDRASSPGDAARTRERALAGRIVPLAAELYEFWKTKGPDPQYGGFYGRLDRQGRMGPPTDKGVIQQARHLWAMAAWAEHKNQRAEVRPMADSLYHFLVDHFRDRDGEFFVKVNDAGDRVLDRSKWIYAQGFAIYGLVEYARVFQVPEAGQTALACFRALDHRAHDARYGGYAAPHDPPWLPSDAAKDTNTLIHLLEPFTTLYQWSSDTLVAERLNELIDVFADKIVQPQAYAHPMFTMQWQPVGASEVSYGHDLESAWLLFEAARAVGRDTEAKVLRAIQAMGTHAALRGFDSSRGGYFEAGIPQGDVTRREKVWWVQAEALLGLWRLYSLTGDTVHLDRMESTMSWIENYQRDRQYGEWFWGILPDGSLGSHGDDKGGEWKASYHNLRALLFAERWIGSRP